MSDLLLLSGGIDSVSVAAWLRPSICLTIDYGQLTAKAEVIASSQVCKELGLHHEILKANVAEIGSGDLSGRVASPHSLNSEFWPFRNQFLITLGAMMAMKMGCKRVLIGTVVTDRRHIDGSQEFISLLSKVLNLQEGNIQLVAPAIDITSTELVKRSGISDGALGWTHSCHIMNIACGVCRGCIKHSEVMAELGWNR